MLGRRHLMRRPCSVKARHPPTSHPARKKQKHTHTHHPDTSLSDGHQQPPTQDPAPPADLSPYIHIIIPSTDSFLYKPIDTFFTDTLQIPPDNADSLLNSLHTHALHTTAGIIKYSGVWTDTSASPPTGQLPPLLRPPSILSFFATVYNIFL